MGTAVSEPQRIPGSQPTALADTVDFQATPEEAEKLLDRLADRLLQARGLPSSSRVNRIWSMHDAWFHGVVEMSTDGATCHLSVSPRSGVDATHHRAYRATIIVTGIGSAESTELAPMLELGQFMPFTDTETCQIRSEMPLTRMVPELFPNGPLADCTAIFTIHHMTDFLTLMESAFALGLQPQDVTVIDKEYRYLHTHRVDAHLKLEHSVRVFKYSQIEEAIRTHIALSERRGKRIMVLDDGGYVLPVVLDRFASKASRFIGLVEQTMSGIWKLEGRVLPLPVFSVAESQLKGTIESYGVADAAVRNVLALLPHEKLEGRSALVVGYGRIGQEVASVLRSRRMQVAVHDRDIVRLVTAHERGFRTSPDLGDLIRDWRPLIIFGSAGAGSMTRPHFEQIQEKCYLVSTTSRDYEFRLQDLSELAESSERIGRLGTVYRMERGHEVVALADGLPINFYYAESLPNRYVDLVLASMLIGACALAVDEPHFVAGHNLERTNRVIAESGIVGRYYDLYRGHANSLDYAL